jgi:hypothetical protein
MSRTIEHPAESPNQIHVMGSAGQIITMDLPLSPVYTEQLANGQLQRVHADGSPYTGKQR